MHRVGVDGSETPLAVDALRPLTGTLAAGEHIAVSFRVTKPIRHASFGTAGTMAPEHPAATAGTRRIRLPGSGECDLPLVRIADNCAGARGVGPAIIEEDFFTCRVPQGWHFHFTAGMDLRLEKRDQ